MSILHVRNIFSSLIRGTAYVSVVLQWLWLVILILPPLLESGALNEFTQPSTGTNAPVLEIEPIELGGASLVIIGIVTVLIVALTAVVLFKLPKTVIKTGDSLVHKTSEIALPVISLHAHLPAKERRRLTVKISLFIQLVASLVPAVVSVLLPPIESLSKDIVVAVAVALFVYSATGFLIAFVIRPMPTSRIRLRASRE